ncbi:hypothetical protein PUN28_016259 [Cardiocondyla obscurior]|uniref:small monomeric GTPase n=1 Tax=Cardiocondyla obscurior TaxID=286306 RepID=A0AAW2ERN0_9HYME
MARQDGRDAADQNFDYMFKLLIIGNSSVGKTSFLFRYADDSFTSAFVSTVGIDFKVKTVFRHEKRVKLQIWDTAGQERYRTITTAYYRGAMGFILMYDITNEESFNSVQDWVTQIKNYSWDNAQVILVGNKCDMEEERVISTERGKQLAEQLGVRFFETSAKENINVKKKTNDRQLNGHDYPFSFPFFFFYVHLTRVRDGLNILFKSSNFHVTDTLEARKHANYHVFIGNNRQL